MDPQQRILLELAWEAPDHRLERTVDSHIKSLRAKLAENLSLKYSYSKITCL